MVTGHSYRRVVAQIAAQVSTLQKDRAHYPRGIIIGATEEKITGKQIV